jgi:pimeloyl-ACP methyl ester carboxylesterase
VHRIVSIWGWTAVAVLALLLLAACGGNGEEAAAPTAEPSPTAEATAAPEDFGQPVSFTTDDGVLIDGRLFGEGGTAVILSHMYPNDQTAWFPFADELAEEDFTALTFDFRGYGDSGGDQEISEIPHDLEAALGFMRDQGFTDIYLVGASMGGSASIIVASEEDVAGVVAISAPQSFQGLEPLEVVADVSEPKLFIASEGDASAASSLELFMEQAPDPKDERVFSGSAHGTELFEGEHGQEVRDLITEFLSSRRPAHYVP